MSRATGFHPIRRVRTARRADAALRRAQSGGRGHDRTGYVTVELGGDGKVAAVRISPGWRRGIAASELGESVREAVHDAGLARLASWGEAFTDERPAPARSSFSC